MPWVLYLRVALRTQLDTVLPQSPLTKVYNSWSTRLRRFGIQSLWL